jgi:hypothetical protein
MPLKKKMSAGTTQPRKTSEKVKSEHVTTGRRSLQGASMSLKIAIGAAELARRRWLRDRQHPRQPCSLRTPMSLWWSLYVSRMIFWIARLGRRLDDRMWQLGTCPFSYIWICMKSKFYVWNFIKFDLPLQFCDKNLLGPTTLGALVWDAAPARKGCLPTLLIDPVKAPTGAYLGSVGIDTLTPTPREKEMGDEQF